MKKLLAMLLAAAMVLSLAACGAKEAPAPAATEEKTEAPKATEEKTEAPATEEASTDAADQSDFVKLDLKFATFLTEQNPAQGVIDTLQAKLDELMPGLFTITTFSNGTLLPGTEIYNGVINGTCDIGLVQPSMMPGQFPVTTIFEYPGLAFNSSEVACRAWDEFVTTTDLDEYKDVKVLTGYGAGPGCIATKDKQLTKMSDFNGLQIRAAGVTGETIAAYGAIPTSMEISECYEALRSGLVDGVYTNFGACGVLAFYEVSKYALITPYGNTVYTYCMNKDTWNKMPPAQQELFEKAIDMTNEEYNFVYGDEGYLTHPANIAAKEAYEINFMEGEFLDECAAAVEPLMSAYIESIEKEGIDGSAYLEKARAIAEKYNADFTMDQFKEYFKTE